MAVATELCLPEWKFIYLYLQVSKINSSRSLQCEFVIFIKHHH